MPRDKLFKGRRDWIYSDFPPLLKYGKHDLLQDNAVIIPGGGLSKPWRKANNSMHPSFHLENSLLKFSLTADSPGTLQGPIPMASSPLIKPSRVLQLPLPRGRINHTFLQLSLSTHSAQLHCVIVYFCVLCVCIFATHPCIGR